MVGGGLAYPVAHSGTEQNDLFWTVFALVLMTVVLLQVLSNWSNDLGDFENGADGEERQDRMVASGQLSALAMRRAVKSLAAVAFVSGLAAVGVALWNYDALLEGAGMIGLGVLAIWAAYRYTAGANPYGYRGLGDLMVLVFFGWVGVMGTAYLLSGTLRPEWLLPATWCGLMSTAVLNLNNMRDHVKDEEAGKRTLVVAMGWERAKAYHAACFVVGWVAWWVFALWVEPGAWRGMGWLGILNAFHFTHAWRVWQCQEPAELDPELKRVALSTAVAALFILLAQTGGMA